MHWLLSELICELGWGVCENVCILGGKALLLACIVNFSLSKVTGGLEVAKAHEQEKINLS